jgi:hypothetical protein
LSSQIVSIHAILCTSKAQGHILLQVFVGLPETSLLPRRNRGFMKKVLQRSQVASTIIFFLPVHFQKKL